MSKQFVKISPEFGFQRARLVYWEFHKGADGMKDVVSLYFQDNPPFVLTGDDVDTFRNWTENEAEAAPITHQPTLFPRPLRAATGLRDTQDLGEISAQQRGK